jgi:peptidoglycan/xylan/chitin deacetylase (PgdA/CDA1 family)
VPLRALAYHDVVEPGQRASSGFSGAGPDRYKLSPHRFGEHLDALRAAGVTIARAGDPDGVLLTFDDGGASAATTIGPALAARGLAGHFFVVTGCLGDPAFVDAGAVRALRDAGHVIGSHSHTHAILTRLPIEDVRDEWARSKAVLEELLGETVDTLAVPRGYVTPRILEAAAGCGYRHLFTSEPWTVPRPVGRALAYGRYSVNETTPTAHVVALATGARRAVWRDASLWYARKAAKRAAGPLYDRVRATLLART